MKEPKHPILCDDKVLYVGDAVALVVAETASSIEEGADLAAAAIDDGRAAGVLDRLVATSRR